MSSFLQDLIDQQRAGDTYGQLDRLGDEHMIKPFLVAREQQRTIAVSCDVEAATEARIRSFYQAIAAGIERSTGSFTTAMIDLSHEGFGRAIVFAGRLVVVSDVLRDAQRFGFDSADKLAAQGDRLVAEGINAIERHKEAARDES
jgi:probable nitrogen fixation protein